MGTTDVKLTLETVDAALIVPGTAVIRQTDFLFEGSRDGRLPGHGFADTSMETELPQGAPV